VAEIHDQGGSGSGLPATPPQSGITLIGLGNLLLRDEGAGIHAIRHLQAHWCIPPELEIVDGGTGGLDLLPFIEKRKKILFVDTVNFSREPGYIGELCNPGIPAFSAMKDSLHHLGLSDVLAAAQLLDLLPKEICLIGIQPQTIETGLELTPAIQSRLEPLVARITDQLEAWGVPCTRRPG
jgi:hydrogenase maturation protease